MFAGVLVAALAAGLAGLGLAARPGTAARAASVSRAAHRTRVAPSVSVAGGSTCYVGITACSESPCVEYVGATSSAVYALPAAGLAQPIRGCPGQGRRAKAGASPGLATLARAVTAGLAQRLASPGP